MTYSSYLVLACITGFLLALAVGKKAGVRPRQLAIALIPAAAFALGGAKLFSIIERGGLTGSLWYELGSGYRYPGAVIAMVAGLAWLRKRMPPGLSAARLADIVAPSFAICTGLSRLGCLADGCCSGTLCPLPWGIEFAAGTKVWYRQLAEGLIEPTTLVSLPVHPLQLYFLIASTSIGILLLWLSPRKLYDGQVFLVYLVLQGTAKFFLENFRHDAVPAVQYTSLAFAMIAAAVVCARGAHHSGLSPVTRTSTSFPTS